MQLKCTTNYNLDVSSKRCLYRTVNQCVSESWVKPKIECRIGFGAIGAPQRLRDSLANPMPHKRCIAQICHDKALELG